MIDCFSLFCFYIASPEDDLFFVKQGQTHTLLVCSLCHPWISWLFEAFDPDLAVFTVSWCLGLPYEVDLLVCWSILLKIEPEL